ncbi:MAG TPA: YbdD/YjiX family protein [Gemmatimonadales bacterium]|nr:YbdD/YjiX family protein [Gemmatimonadales bacterium]
MSADRPRARLVAEHPSDPDRTSGRRRERERLATLGAALARAIAALRRIAGMPDYAAHLEHLRRCHPERPLPTRRQHFEEYLRTRYEGGPTRCC